MEIEYVCDREIRYIFSNENLKVGDKVYPLTMGRKRDDGTWVLHSISFEDYVSGFPDDPHTIEKFVRNEDIYKFAEIITDKGSSPEMCYYKIIKREKQIKEPGPYGRYKWVEINE